MAGNDHATTDRSTDLREHERTFAGFVKFLIWLFGLSIVALIFIALTNI